MGEYRLVALVFTIKSISFELNFEFHHLFQQFFGVTILGLASLIPQHLSSFLLLMYCFHFQVVEYILEVAGRILGGLSAIVLIAWN